MTDSTQQDSEQEEKNEGEEEEMRDEEAQEEEEAEFDPSICANLYNRLIRTGFHGSNREQKGDYFRTNWFEVWQADPKVSKCRERFQQPMVEFLEQIEIVIESNGSAPIEDILTYHLQSIPSPTAVDDDYGLGGPQNDGIDCICLFRGNFGAISHRLGVIMDLADLSVRYLPSFFDYQRPADDYGGWYTLQDFLTKLNSIVEVGKYVPVPCDQKVQSGQQPSIAGWKAIPWTDSILDETLNAWEDLIDTIATRLPDQNSQQDYTQHQTEPLASEDNIPPSICGFTRAFLLRASKPPFKYIAPGLLVYNYNTPPIPRKRDRDGYILYNTQYKELYGEVYHDPIILFPMEESATEELAGLWILPEEDWADTIRLVLPYELKIFPSGAYKPLSGQPTRTALFQGPLCPFFGDHRTSLETLLTFWRSLVEEGVWTVGADGIEGGKEFYQQAEYAENRDWFDVGDCVDFPLPAEIS
ncbi:hypothetical protein MGYG_04870 [Nannizzia gypsea CBS 118893]|uniref:Uncharacterized protein n=1 Tax=Arthroderma gypseum (strain ATCC MYA-4604 / CBS 118893) TaxID=535722 RepID=E4UXC4_ARTGP|nr:hypothetical protein MGYG_04870 [Nannizzia gypsea CBS 118893]EFR01872.1 hypothetical protein MGYG_04870 [Nannizzia gypsea CBS 118893]